MSHVATTDAPHTPQTPRSVRVEISVLLYSLSAGVAWWVIHLAGTAALVPAACEHHITWVLNLITVVTALGAITAIAASVVIMRWESPVAVVNDRNRILGLTALIINVGSLALIILEGIPTLVLSPCR